MSRIGRLGEAGSEKRFGRDLTCGLGKRKVKMKGTSAGGEESGVDGVGLGRIARDMSSEANVMLGGDELPESLGGGGGGEARKSMS